LLCTHNEIKLAKFVVTGTHVTFNGTDISDACARAELVINAAEVETTDFGSAGWTEVIGGIKSGSVSLDFHSDYGTDGVSDLFADLVGTIGIVTLNPSGSAASETNPTYTANVLVTSFTPISGAVGDLATFSVSFPTSGEVGYTIV
jgi:predicted secreted protein